MYVVGLGEVLWDKFSTGKKRLGGAPANFAYHAALFGHEGLVVSAIGPDKDGKGIVRELKAHGLPYHLDCVGFPTGTVDADISNPNAPVYTIHVRCAWSHIPFTDELKEIAERTKAVWHPGAVGTRIPADHPAVPGPLRARLPENL